MAVCIRLKRDGRKHLPFYHIGVFNSRTRRDGRAIEEVGFYDPTEANEENLRVDVERVKYWLGQGAKPSLTVSSLLRKQGLTASMWNGSSNKKRTRVAGAKRAEQKKARSVKVRKKGRTANSKVRGEKKA